MERFFFHIHYGERSEDREGASFASLDGARNAAVVLLGELLRGEADGFWSRPDITIEVTNAKGLVLWSLRTVGSESGAASLAKA